MPIGEAPEPLCAVKAEVNAIFDDAGERTVIRATGGDKASVMGVDDVVVSDAHKVNELLDRIVIAVTGDRGGGAHHNAGKNKGANSQKKQNFEQCETPTRVSFNHNLIIHEKAQLWKY